MIAGRVQNIRPIAIDQFFAAPLVAFAGKIPAFLPWNVWNVGIIGERELFIAVDWLGCFDKKIGCYEAIRIAGVVAEGIFAHHAAIARFFVLESNNAHMAVSDIRVIVDVGYLDADHRSSPHDCVWF